MGDMVTHSTSMTSVNHFHETVTRIKDHAAHVMGKFACESMAIMLCLEGQEDIAVDEVVTATLGYLEAWWTVRRCEDILSDLASGKPPARLETELPDTERGRRDFEVWLGWMKERHPGLSGNVAEV